MTSPAGRVGPVSVGERPHLTQPHFGGGESLLRHKGVWGFSHQSAGKGARVCVHVCWSILFNQNDEGARKLYNIAQILDYFGFKRGRKFCFLNVYVLPTNEMGETA